MSNNFELVVKPHIAVYERIAKNVALAAITQPEGYPNRPEEEDVSAYNRAKTETLDFLHRLGVENFKHEYCKAMAHLGTLPTMEQVNAFEVLSKEYDRVRAVKDNDTMDFIATTFRDFDCGLKIAEGRAYSDAEEEYRRLIEGIQYVSPSINIVESPNGGYKTFVAPMPCRSDSSLYCFVIPYTVRLEPGKPKSIYFGFGLQIATGYSGILHNTRNLARKNIIIDGYIDSNQRGEIVVVAINNSNEPYEICAGTCVAKCGIQRTYSLEIQ